MTTEPSEPSYPRRGEIWRVNFDPTLGAEIRKTRPAVVLSSDGIGRLSIKLVAPIAEALIFIEEVGRFTAFFRT